MTPMVKAAPNEFESSGVLCPLDFRGVRTTSAPVGRLRLPVFRWYLETTIPQFGHSSNFAFWEKPHAGQSKGILVGCGEGFLEEMDLSSSISSVALIS